MLSNEVNDIIHNLRKSKNESKGKPLTAEAAYQVRKNLDEMIGSLPVDEKITVEKIDEKVQGEFYCFDEADPEKLPQHVILFIHGGGFALGSVASRRQLCTKIMLEAKMDAFSVEYGQWPEAVHPTGLLECVAGYQWLLQKGYRPENIHFFGESAGAMLTLTTILYLKDQGQPLPYNACVFSPVAGQALDLPSHEDREERDPMITFERIIPYYEGTDYKSPYVSPALGNYKNFPKLCIHVGSEEVLFDDAVLVFNICREAGVDVSIRIWEELFHVFPLFPCPESELAISEIACFLKTL